MFATIPRASGFQDLKRDQVYVQESRGLAVVEYGFEAIRGIELKLRYELRYSSGIPLIEKVMPTQSVND